MVVASSLPTGLERVLQLLEDGVLQDGIDDEHEGGQDACKEGADTFIAQDGAQRAQRRRLPLVAAATTRQLCGLDVDVGAGIAVGLGLARRHARVDHPDGVGQQHGGAARDGARHHGFRRRQPLARPPGLDRRALEEGARPLVPVVVHEVGHADAEQRRVQARVQAGDALAPHDVSDRVQRRRVRALRLDLRAGRKRDERVSARWRTWVSIDYRQPFG